MKIQSEAEAIAALAAVTAWVQEAPDGVQEGELTASTHRRGRVLASTDKSDSTFGLSTYRTPQAAQDQLDAIEREYQNWLLMSRFQPSVVVGRVLNSPAPPQEASDD